MPDIKDFEINLGDLPASGESRYFSIVGEPGCIFSLEIINEDGYYYNFKTETFAAAKTGLKNKKIGAKGKYQGSIVFPSVGIMMITIYIYGQSVLGQQYILDIGKRDSQMAV